MRAPLFVAFAVSVSACGGPLEDDLATIESPGVTRNGITRNGITRNGITRNGITRNGVEGGEAQDVTAGPLDGASFTSDFEEDTISFLEYVVSCALVPQQTVTISVNGAPHSFSGELGVAWGWESAACDETCQRWVTACLLARTNAYGAEVQISLRGSRLTTTPAEQGRFSAHEGAFFGNIFGNQPRAFACAGSMFDTLALGDEISRIQRRVCANAASNECPITVLGPCRNFVSPPWHLTNERSCNWQSNVDGMLNDCGEVLGTPVYPDGTRRYQEIITTFLSPATPWWMQ